MGLELMGSSTNEIVSQYFLTETTLVSYDHFQTKNVVFLDLKCIARCP